jgi:hypothetical protein
MKFILFFCSLLFTTSYFAQQYEPFEGEFIYSVELIHPETNKAKFISFTTIITNDTLVRTESESPSLGKQTLIKHLQLSKQYVLIDYQGKKYAIQQTIPKDTSASKYTFTTCFGSKKIGGIRAKKIVVSHPNFKEPIAMYYAKNVNPIYLNIFKGIPGLPVQYFIQTEVGLLCYTLREFSKKEVPSTVFTFGKEYEKISFNEFLDRISK